METYLALPSQVVIASTLQSDDAAALFRQRDRQGGRTDLHHGTIGPAGGAVATRDSKAGRSNRQLAFRSTQEEQTDACSTENIQWRMLEVSSTRSYRMELPPRPPLAAGKLATSGDADQPPDGEPCKVHFSDVQIYISPVMPTGGYRMAGAINGIEMSLLLDTGAAVTLLQEEAWSRVIAKEAQDLRKEVHDRDRGGKPFNVRGNSWP